MQPHLLRPKKHLGQNFLTNDAVKNRILDSCCLSENDDVLEIGAGTGALTHGLARRCRRLYAVEIDKGLCGILEDNLDHCDNVDLICGDILKIRLNDFSKKKNMEKLKAVGNLPYYITTPIIEWLISNKDSISDIFIMVQKEYAQRIFSKPSTKSYGALTLYVNYNFKPRLLFRISKGSFYPRPGVDSVFIKLDILTKPPVHVKDEGLFFKLIRSSFNQRRKTLLNSLAAGGILKGDKKALDIALGRAGISSQRRGESLSMEEFAQLANQLWR